MRNNFARVKLFLALLAALAWGCFFYSLAHAVNPVAPKLFKSSDTGAETLSGTTGELLRALDSVLTIHYVFSAISGGTFTDNSTEARLIAGTGFKLFVGPTASNDETYFCHQQKFEQLVFKFSTPGVQGSAVTLAWEYWNGSAWTAYTPDTEGTSTLTADGTVSWTITALTSWATTSVNSKTQYCTRLRYTAGTWSTNPLVGSVTATGWLRYFSGTNQAVYRAGAGNQFYLEVNDAGTGSATDARMRGWETMATWTSYGVNTGTGPFPTVAQFTNGVFARKSAAANSTTRTWYLWADDRTFYLFVFTTDSANNALAFGFGDFYSYTTSDAYRTGIWGRSVESSSITSVEGLGSIITASPAINTYTYTAQYAARNYGSSPAGSVQIGKHTDGAKTSNADICIGNVAFPNGADGNVYLEWLTIHEATNQIRGRLRGLACWLHSAASATDGDTFTGATSGAFNGRTFTAIKGVIAGAAGSSVLVVETSNTVDTQ